ncbi:MAG TPA: thioredoxin-disulfide reductase [Membranihabitans sp.]|nr:thioredoxin-disulfide reductase [Membranihabitans sp.]
MEIQKCVIIGSGPAGYTAAIYAARANLKPVMYVGAEPGGQLMITTEVENYPGYPDGVQGPVMMEDFRKQAERFGTEIFYNVVTEVDFSGDVHTLKLDNGESVQAHTVIIATGASAKWLGLPSEKKFMNKGVSACAVCDGFFFKGQKVAVVGGGDTAAEEATYLSKMTPEVHLLVRRDEMRASKIMQDRVKKTENIKIHWNTEVTEVYGNGEVQGITVMNNQTKEVANLDVTGFFVAIGHKPNTEIFHNILDLDETGYILTKGKTTETNIPGVFASGDAQDKKYRQAVTAAGTGCMAALDAESYLVEKGII